MIRRLSCFLMATFLIGTAVSAYPADNDYLRLARLSYLEGHVSLQYASDVEWSAASINLPLEPGDRIYTGRDGRAEIEIDDGSVYRLAEDTDIEVLSLNENLIQLRILVGLSSLTVSSGLDFEINTPAAAFTTIRQGTYRFEVAENGETAAIVRRGTLEAANNEFVRQIHSNEKLKISLDGRTELAQYNVRDFWDEWNDRRNADMLAYASRQHLPDTVYIGISDLDRYGRWVQVESYGTAWIPYAVDVSWSPYSVGRWCYRPFYGWTWVSYEPWGWLPYHYGRWYRSAGFGWCWLPGAGFSFNFWSPGLVAFYSSPGWVSWCPLGPGDYYNINNYFYNRRAYGYQLAKLRGLYTRAAGRPFYRNDRGAFRSVSLDHFRNGNPHGNGVATRRGYVNLASREGSFVKDRLGIRPTRASYSAAPGRPVSRPGRTRELPAVVRTDPGSRAKNRGGFTKITNPRVNSSSARVARQRNQAAAGGGSRTSDPNVRVVRFGSAEQTNRNARNQVGNNSAAESGRRTAVPRNSGNSGSTTAASANSQRAARTARSQSNASSSAERAPAVRNSSVTPERDRARSSGSNTRSNVQRSPQSSTRAPSTGTAQRRSAESSSTSSFSVTGRSGAYVVRPQSGTSARSSSTAPSTSRARPRVEPRRSVTTPAPSSNISPRRSSGSSSTSRAPAVRRSQSFSTSRRSSSSPQRNSVVRPSRTPSSGRVSRSSAQPSARARSSGGSSAGRSSGQAQRRSGSSGGARRK